MATSDWNGEKIKEDEEFYIVNGNIVDKNELEEQEETVYYDCDGKTYFEDEVECFGNISRAIENIKKRIRFEIDCYTENNNSIHLEEIKKLNNTLQKLKTKD